jgi:HemK-related putative methylase
MLIIPQVTSNLVVHLNQNDGSADTDMSGAESGTNLERWGARERRWSRVLTRWLWRLWRPLMSRHDDQLRVRTVSGIRIVVLPGVFDGVRLRTGAYLAQALDSSTCPPGARALDLGTGSGIGAIVAARYATRVVATDINPEAVRCAQLNALAHHLEERIETRVGDLFEPVRGERFDMILFNPPYFRGHPRDLSDCAWRSPDVFDRFLRELPEHLTPGGRALVVLSSDGDVAAALWSATHLVVRAVRTRDLLNETLTVYEIRTAP